jgi:hypothetical protein
VALVLRAGIVSGLTWCALALAPQARAATFAELPFAAQPGVATCLRATGEPGELIRFGPLTRTSSAIDVQRVGEAGAQRIQRIAFGQLLDCPAAAAAGGAGVIAGPVRTGRRTGEMQVSLREPGGAFGAPARLGTASVDVGQPAAAIAPSGAAVVVWALRRAKRSALPFDVDRAKVRILATLRPAGCTFGPAVALTPWRPAGPIADVRLAAAIDPAGRVVVTWRTAVPARRAFFVVQARPIPRGYDPDSFTYRRGRGRSSFRAVLKLPRSVHRVAVEAYSIDDARNRRVVVVPISG